MPTTQTVGTVGYFGRTDARFLSIGTWGYYGDIAPVAKLKTWDDRYNHPSYLYQTCQGVAPDAYGDYVQFEIGTRIVMLIIRDHAAVIEFQFRGSAGQERVFEAAVFMVENPQGFRIRNQTPGNVARYQVIPFR